MAPPSEFVEHVLDLLAPLGSVAARRMFGGWGLFMEGVMFALIASDTLYLKADDANRGDFEAAGCPPFTYTARGKRNALGYWQAPADAMEDGAELLPWARGAFEAALRADAAKRRDRRA